MAKTPNPAALAPLFHFVKGEQPPAAWPYAPPSLRSEGFIHLCDQKRLDEVRGRFFADTPLIVLVLDTTRLSDVRVEDTTGHGAFPHLYGVIEARSVLAAVVVGAGETVAAALERTTALRR